MIDSTELQINPALHGADYTRKQQATIDEAIGILEDRISKSDTFTMSAAVKRYCQLHLAKEKDEHFGCLYLDNQHRLISFEKHFSGTIDGASVYARPIVRAALEQNAAAVIFTHNHPSGCVQPSQADAAITKKLNQALALIDVRVVDHIVVGSEGCLSMAESGHF